MGAVCAQFQLNPVQAILARMEGDVRTAEMDSTVHVLNSSLTGPVAQVGLHMDIPKIIRRGDLSFLVSCALFFIHSGVINRIAPRIVTSPQSATGKLGSTVTLTCTAEGNPRPEIIWYRDGKQVNVATVDSTHLVITLTPENRGFYHCVALNSEGQVHTDRVLVSIEGQGLCCSSSDNPGLSQKTIKIFYHVQFHVNNAHRLLIFNFSERIFILD